MPFLHTQQPRSKQLVHSNHPLSNPFQQPPPAQQYPLFIMPKAYTYFNMQQMIAAQVPADIYHFELYPRWFRKQGSKIGSVEKLELLKEVEGMLIHII